MARPKGTPKTGGRKKGTRNRVTTTIKYWLTELINDNRNQIKKDLQALKPAERLMLLVKILPYVLPKQEDIHINDTPQVVPFPELMRSLGVDNNVTEADLYED